MTFHREQSANLEENSMNCPGNLNETQLSHLTRESGEVDFKELESLINKTVREDKCNVSVMSNSKVVDKSNSILSNDEIWKGSQPLDDSKNFIKNYKDLDEKKKKVSIFKKGKMNKNMTKKPNHLIVSINSSEINMDIYQINTGNQVNVKRNEADEEVDYNYNEDLDERVAPKKEEQVNQLGKLETKNINLENLNENTANINTNSNTGINKNTNSNTSPSSLNPNATVFTPSYANYYDPNSNSHRMKFYTSPDELYAYRTLYSYNNFPFTPHNQTMFPAIPMRYILTNNNTTNEQDKLNEGEESGHSNYFSQTNLINQTANDSSDNNNNKSAKITKRREESQDSKKNKENIQTNNGAVLSTRNSTDSNESLQGDTGNAGINAKKFLTPTHQNITRAYTFTAGKELDFSNTPQAKLSGVNVVNRHGMGFPMNSISNIPITATNNNIVGLNLKPSANMLKYQSRPITTNNNIPTQTTLRSDENNDYKINLENIIIGKDKRTTLMLRNIPNKYTLQNLVEEINPSFWGKYDYINLPIDYERKLNLGYAFINFIDPMHIVLFYETYFNKKWSKYRSDKKIDLNYAEKQGKKDITCRDENTYFASEDKKFNFKKISPKTELPMKYFDFFKKIYPNSVCIVENKNGIVGDKNFHVKSLGKR